MEKGWDVLHKRNPFQYTKETYDHDYEYILNFNNYIHIIHYSD